MAGEYESTTSASTSQAGADVDPRERALISRFQNTIDSAIEDNKDRRKRCVELARYVRGVQGLENELVRDPDEVRANLILGIMQTLVPLYYAKDPEIDVSPEEQVLDVSYEALGVFCTTLRIVLNRLFVRDAKLKPRITRAISSAMTNGVAWLKVSYQRNYWTDPIIRNRLADAQDNLARIKSLTSQVEKAEGDTDAQQAELEQQIAAMQEKVEVLVEEGLVIDFVADEDILILDESLTTFSEYPQARAIAHRLYMTCSDFEERFGKRPTGTKYADKRDARAGEAGAAKKQRREQFVCVYEIWDRASQSIYTMESGAREWARAPYRPERVGRRWYSFFGLFWNEVDGQFYPLADVESLTGLQDEYNRMRTQLAQAREENKPGFVGRKGGALTDEDVRNVANRKGRSIVLVGTNGANTPLKDELVPFPTFQIDPTVYDTTPVLRDLEQTSGASDASRASIQKAKTATEAEIQAQGMQSRTAYRQDMIEDFIAEMGQYAAQIFLQELSTAQVERVAGQGYVWPAMPRDDVFDMVNVSIRAGSTGKPNRHQERDAWVQLSPMLLQMIDKVLMLRSQGLNDQAEGVIEMLRETMRRFDERIDIEKYFPPLPAPAVQPPMPGAMPGAAPNAMPPGGMDPALAESMAGAQPPAGGVPANLPVGA